MLVASRGFACPVESTGCRCVGLVLERMFDGDVGDEDGDELWNGIGFVTDHDFV